MIDVGAPTHADAELRGATFEKLVKMRPPDGESGPIRAREARLHRGGRVYEADASQGKGLFQRGRDAESSQYFDAARENAFPASFVDGRHGAVHQGNVQALKARGDGCGQSSGAPADDYDIAFHSSPALLNSSRKSLP
jgi:hypothetical protein